MWSEKYRPQNIFDMVGNEEARKQFVEWFAKWKKGTKPLLLVGPPGIGKTTMSFLAGKQFGYDMISLNASDVRNKKNIQEILTPVLGNQTVLGEPMIFIDEVDGIHGRSDYGGVEALINILKEPTVPIVLAGNYDSSDKMKKIKKVVKTLQISPLSPRFLKLYLNMILEKENAVIDFRKLIGATNPEEADEGTIRKKFALSLEKNSVHGSDSPENAEIEINHFFDEADIIS